MQIDRLLILAAMLVIGFAVGLVYFQGLWLTLSRYSGQKNLGSKLLLSFLIRLTLAIGIFYYSMQDDWQRLILLLIGFLIARQVMIRRLREPAPAAKPNMN
ncbi:MAG: ATP synthase subunit I [Proteobacteria bacterium]|nr:ATP synthase subunit I [Pseudomonadota bacterium]MBU0965934.1 ATP synthase subunit I [Pseudomonadota bacterium]MBU4260818.1 ATP synthase subunit I [Pseudomonadota bacterium]MBU4295681.1 ATP synthase subunit I [Pseudomonadota bacterium]MCG2746872.1 ATP synthase subunit I [Desulfobulbaceae bacterium]